MLEPGRPSCSAPYRGLLHAEGHCVMQSLFAKAPRLFKMCVMFANFLVYRAFLPPGAVLDVEAMAHLEMLL